MAIWITWYVKWACRSYPFLTDVLKFIAYYDCILKLDIFSYWMVFREKYSMSSTWTRHTELLLSYNTGLLRETEKEKAYLEIFNSKPKQNENGFITPDSERTLLGSGHKSQHFAAITSPHPEAHCRLNLHCQIICCLFTGRYASEKLASNWLDFPFKEDWTKD